MDKDYGHFKASQPTGQSCCEDNLTLPGSTSEPANHHQVYRDLALGHWKHFVQSGDQEELENSIHHSRTALRLCPEGSSDYSELLYILARSLRARYEKWGQIEDLEETIKLHRAGLASRPGGHPDHSASLHNLATSLQARFEQCGRTEDLDEAIELLRVALELRPKGHHLRSSSLLSLVNCMQLRIKRCRRTVDLDEAIELYHATLELCPEDHPHRFSCLDDLANNLKSRFKRDGRIEDLDEAIDLHRSALELRPEGHPGRAASLYYLANSVQTRFQRRGRLEDLEEAIKLHNAALDLCPDGHPDRTKSLDNLASAMKWRFKQHSRIEDLDKAIKLYRATLELHPEGHPLRCASINNLANSLKFRFGQQGRTEDLDEAIKLLRAALGLLEKDHPKRSACLNNLAGAVQVRYEQHGRSEDLDEAVELLCATLELCPEGHPDHPASLNNLATSMQERFKQRGQIEYLDLTIKLHRAALELHTKGHPDHAASLYNLANSMKTRFEQDGRIEDLNEAVELHRTALELRPKGHLEHSASLISLANSMKTRFERNGYTEDLDEAIELHRAALELHPEGHPGRSLSLINLADSLYARVEQQRNVEQFAECMQLLELAATHKFSGLKVCLEAARRWAALARMHNHDSALRAFKAAMSVLQRALAVGPTLHEQHDFLKSNGSWGTLAVEATSYSIEKDDLELAVEILEQGRGLLWSQLRGLRAPLDQLAEINKDLVDRFRNVSRRLENLATSYERSGSSSTLDGDGLLVPDVQLRQKAFDELLRLKKRLTTEQEKVINEIRRISGFESFLDAMPFEVLRQAASEGPVIVVNHCEYRSDALIILPRVDSPVVCVPLDKGFYEDTINVYNEFLMTRRCFGADSPNYDEKLREAMKMLWDGVVSKVVDKLERLGIAKGARIWWCPTSVLSALPFHAAGPFKSADGTMKHLLDDYTSSYTPTLGALVNARSRGVEEEPTVLVIGDISLRSAKQEITNIRNCGLSTKLLIGSKASREAVSKAVQEATWVHFVCHGHLGSKALNTSFNLPDGGLTLLDIVKARLPDAEFAFLSACHTAQQPHDSAHDEVLHLAAAMQFSGFRSVIGSMWELLDDDGPHFAKFIYGYMNDCEEGEAKYKRAAAGLRKAALELKARDGIATERWVNLVHIGA